jgi:GTP-binding protein
LAILIEMMRREGYELMVGKPEILTRTINGKLNEPVELLVIDCPEAFIGRGYREAWRAQGQDEQDGEPRLRARAAGVSRAVARPDRAAQRDPDRHARHGHHELAVLRVHRVAGRDPHAPHWVAGGGPRRQVHRPYAIFNLQERGEIFVSPGTEVYEGMIVGENARTKDLDVNIVKEKKLTNMRASTADEAIRLVPPRILEPGAVHRVHPGRRVRGSDAGFDPAAQEES